MILATVLYLINMIKKTDKKDVSLGQRIKQLRKAKDWSQEQLGEKIDIHIQTIARYEKDTIIPTATVLKNLAEAFGVSIDYLVFGDTDSTGIHVQNKDLFKRFQQLDRVNPDKIKGLIEVMDVYIQKNAAEILAIKEI